MKPNKERYPRAFRMLVFALFIGLLVFPMAISTPYGPVIDSNTTEDPGEKQTGTLMNHTKGKITTVLFNLSQPNSDWKGYVGNISGTLVLDDANNNTLFEWSFTTLTGEVFATRASGTPTWTSISCADSGEVATENTFFSHGTDIDNITNTFDNGNHKQVIVGGNTISANSCSYSDYTYVSDAAQTSTFSEVLLHDGSNIVYTSVLEDDSTGFDGTSYDFQMILPDNGDTSINTAFYFYVELG